MRRFAWIWLSIFKFFVKSPSKTKKSKCFKILSSSAASGTDVKDNAKEYPFFLAALSNSSKLIVSFSNIYNSSWFKHKEKWDTLTWKSFSTMHCNIGSDI